MIREHPHRFIAAVLIGIVVGQFAHHGCATNGPAVRPTIDPVGQWADYHHTMDGIECAMRSVMSDEQVSIALGFSVHAVADDGVIDNCTTWMTSRRIEVRDSYRTARASCLRHEFFAHIVPWLTTGDPNLCSGPPPECVHRHEVKWQPLEGVLNVEFARCTEATQ